MWYRAATRGAPYRQLTILLLSILLLTNCRPDPPGDVVTLSPHHTLVFLDSLAAAEAISQDQAEGFFERIQPLDVAIQMRQPLPEAGQREAMLPAYREFLRADVAAFTPGERQRLQRAFRRAFELCQPFRSDFFPDTVLLVKTQGRHYGPSVYYTRERCIVIPQNELGQRDVEALAEVMLHELFHLYSRREPQQREQLYGLLGFQRLGQPVALPACLQQRLMLNPDGMADTYALPLKGPEGETILALPLLLADTSTYLPGRAYFDYLDFRLFPLQAADGAWSVATTPGCRSPLPPPDSLPAFWAQIGDNTTYIIHPDEILADNFVLLALSKDGQRLPLSPRGRLILEGLEEVLQQESDTFREPQEY
jgi:hypothetical protein